MKKLWILMGKITFWLSWPALFIYFKLHNERTRVIVTNGDDLLVVKGWLGDGAWSLPGGGLHRHEEPISSALRELREETGIEAEPKQLKFFKTITARRLGLVFNLYCYSFDLQEKVTPKFKGGEIVAR